jgi:tetratricopeptide (TPR) repeat protein
LRKAVELAPDDAGALAGRGLCYLELERYAPAEASFQAALETDPRHEDALLGLAETYRWQGRKKEAIRYYNDYLAAHPDGDDAEAARNAVQNLEE